MPFEIGGQTEETLEARLLEYFLRAVELGSINRAAAELNLSQPSLSRWLSILEREVGNPLLIRTRQGIRPTDAGEILAERARPILRQLNELRAEIGEKASAQATLGMPCSMQQFVTAPFAHRLAQENPHLSVRIYEGINNDLRRWMEQGLVDAGVMVCTERAPDAFTTIPLVCEQLILVGARNDGLRLDKPVSISRLGAVPLILPGRPNVIRAHVEHAIHRTGGTYHNRLDAEMPSLCLELVRRGLGYTVMPYCVLHGKVDGASDLSAAPIKNLKVIWALHINRSREHSVTVRTVIQELRSFMKTLVASGDWRFAETIHGERGRRNVRASIY